MTYQALIIGLTFFYTLYIINYEPFYSATLIFNTMPFDFDLIQKVYKQISKK